MTHNQDNNLVGNRLLNKMSGDDQKGKKMPGTIFWSLFCILFLAGCVAFIWLFGEILTGDKKPQAELPSVTTTTNETHVMESPALPPPPSKESDLEAQTEIINKTEKSEVKTEEKPEDKKPQTIGQTDIYLDENGVWRNLNRDDESQIAKVEKSNADKGKQLEPQNPQTQELNDNKQTAKKEDQGILPIMSKLLNGSGQGINGDDLAFMADLASNLLGESQSSNKENKVAADGNPIFSIISEFLGPNSNPFQNIGAVDSILNPFTARPTLSEEEKEALNHENHLNEKRHKMQAQIAENEKKIKELKEQAKQDEVKKSFVQNIDDFERFDHNDARNIKSQWEYFNDPR